MDIVEVIRRTQQGVTQPYLCRAEDDALYFVKGRGAGFPSLIKEWLAGSLAKAFELPIPHFEILNVPKNLYDAGRAGMLADLGHGAVFGSKEVSNVNEITTADVTKMPSDMKRKIAVFDWWIMNGDRTLSESGGNPNILWEVSDGRPFVIDHNLAFDDTVTLRTLEDEHVFGSMLAEVIEEPSLQGFWTAEFQRCLQHWDDFCRALPERWSYVDDRRSIISDFDPDGALAKLKRFETSDIWKRR